MKKYKTPDSEIYSKEELKMFRDIEAGKWKPMPEKEFIKEKARLKKIAENTLKRKSINIRVIESDIEKIKSIASSEGMPYQTFITSVLHKVATGKVVSY